MERRQFLKRSAAAGAALAFSSKSLWAKEADAHIEVLMDEPLGEISPNIYGQFTEHIGGVIYDGVCGGAACPSTGTEDCCDSFGDGATARVSDSEIDAMLNSSFDATRA